MKKKSKKRSCGTIHPKFVAQTEELQWFSYFILPEMEARFEPKSQDLKRAYISLRLEFDDFHHESCYLLWHKKEK